MTTTKYILLLFSIASLHQECAAGWDTCNATVPCPLSNGIQKNCEYQMGIGGGCACYTCLCPRHAPEIYSLGCVLLPTKVGQSCLHRSSSPDLRNYTLSCSLIPGNPECHAISKTCQCKTDFYPSDDLAACIPKPVALGESCSREANCEDNIFRGICSEEGRCVCETGFFPHVDGRSCIEAPRNVGEMCAEANPCDNIPFAECVLKGQDEILTCQCPPLYKVPHIGEANRCLASQIGLPCLRESSNCDLLQGARCYGSDAKSVCLCPNGFPNEELTKCGR